jgi:hypothetical protein
MFRIAVCCFCFVLGLSSASVATSAFAQRGNLRDDAPTFPIVRVDDEFVVPKNPKPRRDFDRVVATAAELKKAFATAVDGETIALEPGTYRLGRTLETGPRLEKKRLTLVGKSGKFSDVRLEAASTVGRGAELCVEDLTVVAEGERAVVCCEDATSVFKATRCVFVCEEKKGGEDELGVALIYVWPGRCELADCRVLSTNSMFGAICVGSDGAGELDAKNCEFVGLVDISGTSTLSRLTNCRLRGALVDWLGLGKEEARADALGAAPAPAPAAPNFDALGAAPAPVPVEVNWGEGGVRLGAFGDDGATPRCEIVDCNIADCRVGIKVLDGAEATVRGGEIRDCEVGVDVSGVVAIDGSTFEHCETGVSVAGKATVRDGEFRFCRSGVEANGEGTLALNGTKISGGEIGVHCVGGKCVATDATFRDVAAVATVEDGGKFDAKNVSCEASQDIPPGVRF